MKPASAFAILLVISAISESRIMVMFDDEKVLVISALSESRVMVKFDLAKVLFIDLLTKYTDYHLAGVARNEK